MDELYHRLLFLFVDGVGLAPPSPHNPWSTEPTPAIDRLLGGPLTADSVQRREGLLLAPLDATLGVEGLPQSATGQASLFTGRNGARRLGRHQTGLPGPRMRELVVEHGLLGRAVAAGASVTFANAYSRGYLDDLATGKAKPSVTTIAARAAGLELRTLEDLVRGAAVTWDLCRDLAGRRAAVELAAIEPAAAGRHLVAISRDHDLTLFETFVTDLAGHLKRGVEPAEAVRRIDRLVDGIERARDPGLTWLLTSDHGNLEDVSVRGHTRNPVPLLAVGPAAGSFASARSILDVADLVLTVLSPGA